MTKALQPGTVTIICGNVGASKSFMLLEASAYWHENGIKTAIFQLEEDRDFHLSRCLAQKSGTAGITDPDWIRDSPEQARALYAENEAWLGNFGACIFASPDTQPTLEQLAEWTKVRVKAGCRIIAVDPITAAAHKMRNVWEEDSAFLHDIKRMATDYRCSVAGHFCDGVQSSGSDGPDRAYAHENRDSEEAAVVGVRASPMGRVKLSDPGAMAGYEGLKIFYRKRNGA